jgi:hypothetical protein
MNTLHFPFGLCTCLPGLVCDACVRSYPRLYMPPGPEREAALKVIEDLRKAAETKVEKR